MSEPIPELTVRNPIEADEVQMVELLSRAFHRWPQFEIPVPAIEHLRWKMRSDPVAGRHHWVGEIDDRIVVMLLRIIRRIRVRGRDCLARDGVDAAVDPRYQERGLYGSMVDESKKRPQHSEVDLSLSLTSNPKLQGRNTRQGSRRHANPIQALQRPYRPRAIVARRRTRYRERIPAPLAALRIELESILNRIRHWPYWSPVEPDWSIATLERFDERIEDFFDEAARPFDFLVVRSSDYMNWRYCEPAAGRFTIRVAEHEGRILGYLILKISEGNGYIADLLALPGRIDVVRFLVEDALRLSREARAEMVSCWVIARHPYNGLLRRYGFVDSGRDLGFVYNTFRLDPQALEFLEEATARIHLMQGDSDWI
jgi:hypothetical protein